MAPSKYYWLSAEPDPAHANWLLWRYTDEPRKTLRERYERFQCAKCKKVDELKALKSGLDEDVVIRTRCDFTRSYDDFLCVKSKVAALLASLGVTGVICQPLPDGNHFVVVPKRLIHIRDLTTSGIRIYKECPACVRPREAKGIPALRSLKIPPRGFDFGLMWPCLETYQGRDFRFIISERVHDAFRTARVRGARYRELH